MSECVCERGGEGGRDREIEEETERGETEGEREANLHANFHGFQLGKRHLPGLQLPQQDGEAPHVSGPDIDVLR